MEGWKERGEERPEIVFNRGIQRNLQFWDFENCLTDINVNAAAIQEWSRHYSNIAKEQLREQRQVPDRMPTIEECDDILSKQKKISESLLWIKRAIKEQNDFVEEQRLREHNGKRAANYDEEMNMYDEGRETQGFGGLESKKRRGVCFHL